MKLGKKRREIPLILALIPKFENHIFNIRSLPHLSIRVKSLKNRTKINQCHNCQQFGHGQSNCHAPPKCVKCSGDHHTASCSKPNNTPATCANCGGPHPANYSRCIKHRDNNKKTTEHTTQVNIANPRNYTQTW